MHRVVVDRHKPPAHPPMSASTKHGRTRALNTHPYQSAPSVTFPTLTQHAPSFWFPWLSFPGRPAAVSPVHPAYRTPAPSSACGSVPQGATGAPGPSGSRGGSARVGAPAETAQWRTNTDPASVESGSDNIFKCANSARRAQIKIGSACMATESQQAK